jgi:hypothetical protein
LNRHYSNASSTPRLAPGRLPFAIGVSLDPCGFPVVGIAFPDGQVGGHDWESERLHGKPEAVWRLVIGKEELEGRFALRSGEFVELAESAE